MKSGIKLPTAGFLLTAPLAAYADGIPHIEALYSFGGGLAGGLIGALLACWLCNRKRDSNNQSNSKR